jgi:L-lactate dehydrogenase complex protein LldE
MLTCLDSTVFPRTGIATVEILEGLGHRVHFPIQQGCCGQMHINSGHVAAALPLVRHHVTVFEPYPVIVSPAGSCAGCVRHQHAWVAEQAGDAELAERARAVAARTYELSELLVDALGLDDLGAVFPHRVAFHQSCHSERALRIGDKPLRLLRNVDGLDLVTPKDADTCCGFGGTFSVKNADLSVAMGFDKCAAIRATDAQVLCSTDNSCLMHLSGLLGRQRAGVRVMHLAEILATGFARA